MSGNSSNDWIYLEYKDIPEKDRGIFMSASIKPPVGHIPRKYYTEQLAKAYEIYLEKRANPQISREPEDRTGDKQRQGDNPDGEIKTPQESGRNQYNSYRSYEFRPYEFRPYYYVTEAELQSRKELLDKVFDDIKTDCMDSFFLNECEGRCAYCNLRQYNWTDESNRRLKEEYHVEW